MKTKLQLTIAAFTLAVFGQNVAAQSTFTYNFNTDLAGVVTAAGGGSPAVGSMPLAAPTSTRPIFDGTVQNTTGVLRQQVINNLTNNTNVNDLTSFPSALDYSVTWKEYLVATPPATIDGATINSHRRGFLLRGQSVAGTPYAPGIRNGYYFYLQGDHTSPGRIQFTIRPVINGALATNFVTPTAYLDGGTTPISLDKAYWYRASVTGTNPVVLKFEYSLDGINFVTAATHNDSSAGRFTTAGLTQTVSGIGFASYIWQYYDNITFDTVTLGTQDVKLSNNSVSVFKNDNSITINSSDVTIQSVELFDVSGRVLARKNNVNALETSFTNLNLGKGLVLVQVTGADGSIQTRKVAY